MPKLTKKVVETAKPSPDGSDRFLRDSALPGFAARLYPSGTRKYIVQYRTKDNRQRRMVLGLHGVLTVENARNMAREILLEVSKGGDPAAEKKAARMAPTLRDLAADYIERHAIPNKQPSSVAADKAMIEKVILPKLGNVKVSVVSRPDVEKLHNRLKSKPYTANRQNGISVVRTRKYKVTTDSNHSFNIASNLLNRNFMADAPDRKWAGDISYIWTREGWLYLAVMLDLHSRRVIGWAVSNRLKRDLAIRALDMAVALRKPMPGCIHHTDRGSQYRSHDYQKRLRQHGFKVSMSGKGNCGACPRA